MKEYDIIVIGAGGGTKLVTPPSQIGKKVAVFEKESPGGTCLNRGCIPSKMLIYPSEILRFPQESEKFPIRFPSLPEADFSTIVKRVSDTVDADSASIPVAYDKNPNIDYYPYFARFLSDKVIEANGETFTAKHIFITVGTRPLVPEIPGLKETPFWTSREALRPDSLPQSMIVLGAGFISLELGAAYAAYGCKVTGFARKDVMKDLYGEVKEELKSNLPFPIHTHSAIQNVTFDGKNFSVTAKDKEGNSFVTTAEKLLVATGIIPNTDDLGLENTKVKINEKGFIEVNDFLETSVSGVFAFGDVIGRHFFRHSANFEGEYLFQNLFLSETSSPIHYPPMPSAVFTHPQIASVGSTEEELIRKQIHYYKGVNRYSSSAMGMARMSTTGFVKVLIDKQKETILGAHIIGDEASNMIHHLVLGMNLNANLDQLLNMIYIHPALPEITRNALRKVKEERKKEKGF